MIHQTAKEAVLSIDQSPLVPGHALGRPYCEEFHQEVPDRKTMGV